MADNVIYACHNGLFNKDMHRFFALAHQLRGLGYITKKIKMLNN